MLLWLINFNLLAYEQLLNFSLEFTNKIIDLSIISSLATFVELSLSFSFAEIETQHNTHNIDF